MTVPLPFRSSWRLLSFLIPLSYGISGANDFVPFTPADTSFTHRGAHTLSPGLVSKILMQTGVSVATNKNKATTTVRDYLDFIGYIPIDGRSDSGYIIVNNETESRSDVQGDGGGMVVFTAEFKDNTWSVVPHPDGDYRLVDFSSVGGTFTNCGGAMTPWGTVLTGEEWTTDYTDNNRLLHNNGNRIRDTSDWLVTEFNGQPLNKHIRRYQNMNWVVEVDPVKAVALKKHYNMGRAGHELGYPMPDGRTVYVTDDFTPAAFFRFVSETAGNYNRGQLYAYKQSSDGESGTWLPMPMDLDSMILARDVAFRRGGAAFTRHEWVVHHGDKVYITETGNDNSGTAHRNAVRQGATLPRHLSQRLNTDSSITDYYGRILRLDTTTWKMDVLLEGGNAAGGLNFSNPDCLTTVTLGSKTYLVICEDIIGRTQNRVPSSVSQDYSELYWLDLSIENPTRDDLKRMLVGARGAEVTGARFTPDGKTMFVNIQHPASGNTAPYNRSYTLAIWGYETPTGLIFDPPKFERSEKLQVSVNMVSRIAYFDRRTDVSLYNTAGRRLDRQRNTDRLDIAQLVPGTYFLRFPDGVSHTFQVQ